MPFLRKLNLQLASKMRFISAQLIALLEGDLWLRSAQHSNAMAQLLASGVQGVEGVRITQPVQANAVFAVLDVDIANKLRESFRFYDWNPRLREVRWMCAFDTTKADVDEFVGELQRLLAQAQLGR
jgi:threonine aldolase